MPTARVHNVDQAVVVSTDSMTLVLEWCLRGYDEMLRVVAPEDAATAGIDAEDVSGLEPWASVLGSPVVGFGVATQLSESGRTVLWSLRMDFGKAGGVVVALGELRGAAPEYQPDNLVVISDPDIAQAHQVLDAPESAWGRALHLQGGVER
ncbi:hypothetical protein ACQPYH_18520 [Kribbella sp. CA-245084]|uniref:hypothetical protein n=1 Tax=Kribbella sp. CA-245084 TaxID=3239940 RepID=UPI003D93FB85